VCGSIQGIVLLCAQTGLIRKHEFVLMVSLAMGTGSAAVDMNMNDSGDSVPPRLVDTPINKIIMTCLTAQNSLGLPKFDPLYTPTVDAAIAGPRQYLWAG
jgi:hypothetical protein